MLEKAGITTNKNAIPNDPRKPWDPSGVRLGTPALTTRGMKEKEMEEVAKYIHRALTECKSDEDFVKLKDEIKEFTAIFKIPGIN